MIRAHLCDSYYTNESLEFKWIGGVRVPQLWTVVWLLVLIVAGVCLTYAVMSLRASRRRGPRQKQEISLDVDVDSAKRTAESLSAAIRFRTVSNQTVSGIEAVEFVKLRDYLKKRFPRVHRELQREVVADASLLFYWAAPTPQGQPILLLGHLDVVPADGQWEHPPFEGVQSDGYVWGRGALESKNVVISLLEAVEVLLGRGVTLTRDVYIAFTHDHESGQSTGAAAMARIFAARNLSFYMVLDQGGWLTRGTLPLRLPVAQIGVAEKGQMTVEATVHTRGGLSATPPQHSALGKLAEAVARIEYKPFPARLTTLVRTQLTHMMTDLPFRWRFALANLPFTTRQLLRLCALDPKLDALVRTTIAVTTATAGSNVNVLPLEARMQMDIRLLQGDNSDDVLRYLQDLVSDLDVTLRMIHATEPSVLAPYEEEPFDILRTCVKDVFGGVNVVPSLISTMSDAVHFERFATHVYRFAPFSLTQLDLQRLHAVDEGVRIDSLGLAVTFYRELLLRTVTTNQNMDGGD